MLLRESVAPPRSGDLPAAGAGEGALVDGEDGDSVCFVVGASTVGIGVLGDWEGLEAALPHDDLLIPLCA